MSQHLNHKFILPIIIIGVISIITTIIFPVIPNEPLNEFVIKETYFLPDTTLGGTITTQGRSITIMFQILPADVPIYISLENNNGSYTWEREIRGDQRIIIDNIEDRFLELKIQNNAEKPVSFQAVIQDVSEFTISNHVGEKEAISLIKKQYPQLHDFPSNDLPPKVIRVEKSNNGWYVVFETQGSGIPLIEAECFFVDNSKTVTLIGKYKPQGINMTSNISFKTCS